ncbi:MAG: hypothetical protein AAB457_03580 [Patescibacteria group bacterium]
MSETPTTPGTAGVEPITPPDKGHLTDLVDSGTNDMIIATTDPRVAAVAQEALKEASRQIVDNQK